MVGLVNQGTSKLQVTDSGLAWGEEFLTQGSSQRSIQLTMRISVMRHTRDNRAPQQGEGGFVPGKWGTHFPFSCYKVQLKY